MRAAAAAPGLGAAIDYTPSPPCALAENLRRDAKDDDDRHLADELAAAHERAMRAHGFESPIDGPTPGSGWITPAFKDGCAPAAPRRIALPTPRAPPPAAAEDVPWQTASFDGLSLDDELKGFAEARGETWRGLCTPPKFGGFDSSRDTSTVTPRAADAEISPGIAAAAEAALAAETVSQTAAAAEAAAESAAEHERAMAALEAHNEEAAAELAAAAAAAAAESDAASARVEAYFAKAEAAAQSMAAQENALAQTVGYPSDGEADAPADTTFFKLSTDKLRPSALAEARAEAEAAEAGGGGAPSALAQARAEAWDLDGASSSDDDDDGGAPSSARSHRRAPPAGEARRREAQVRPQDDRTRARPEPAQEPPPVPAPAAAEPRRRRGGVDAGAGGGDDAAAAVAPEAVGRAAEGAARPQEGAREAPAARPSTRGAATSSLGRWRPAA